MWRKALALFLTLLVLSSWAADLAAHGTPDPSDDISARDSNHFFGVEGQHQQLSPGKGPSLALVTNFALTGNGRLVHPSRRGFANSVVFPEAHPNALYAFMSLQR
jgi:hypothetical protein